MCVYIQVQVQAYTQVYIPFLHYPIVSTHEGKRGFVYVHVQVCVSHLWETFQMSRMWPVEDILGQTRVP